LRAPEVTDPDHTSTSKAAAETGWQGGEFDARIDFVASGHQPLHDLGWHAELDLDTISVEPLKPWCIQVRLGIQAVHNLIEHELDVRLWLDRSSDDAERP
jgi:hypothetical protein